LRFLAIILFLLSAAMLNAQEQKPLRMHLVDGTSHKIGWSVRNGHWVRVVTTDGKRSFGAIKLHSENLFSVGNDSINPEDVFTLKYCTPAFIALFTSPLIIIDPQLGYITLGAFIYEEFTTRSKGNDFVVINRLKKKETTALLQNDSINQLSGKDTLKTPVKKENAKKLANDSIRLEKRLLRSEDPSEFCFIGTDLEKLPVPNFTLNFDNYFRPNWGIALQAGYKPLSPNGYVYSVRRVNEPDCISSHIMFRLNPVFTFTDRSDSSCFYFIGPSLYFKQIVGDSIKVYQSNYISTHSRPSTYWHDKTVNGIGVRMGYSSKRKVGLSFSCELSLRQFSQYDDIIRYDGSTLQTDDDGMYFNIDFSVALRLKLRKHH